MEVELERLCAYDDGAYNEYCDTYLSDYECPVPTSAAYQHGFVHSNATGAFCPAPVMDEQESRSGETLHKVWHIFCTIVPILYWFAIARVVAQLWPRTAHSQSTLRFALEFVLIALPTIVNVNVANDYVEYFVLTASLALLMILWRRWESLQRARDTTFYMGKRLRLLTLVRATINFITSLCILAIDFESFPKDFRKSRRYGAGLMDVGIGLFVYSMGVVSRRPRRPSDFGRLMRMVAPMLLLGLARTLVILAIDYHQDEHEYGVHLNAFFTLGLTKLFGALLSAVATADSQLLALGLGTLALHEIVLQCGVSSFVMDPYMERSNFWRANREGLCSLPGFVGIYLISMYVGQWLQQKTTLSCTEMLQRLKILSLGTATTWLSLVVCIFSVGIARVTSNFGYSAWILSIAITMTMLFMLFFDFIIYLLWPVQAVAQSLEDASEAAMLPKSNGTTAANNNNKELHLPTLVEAVNQNGLLFFLLANVLTGGVNIFLKPENRTNFEGVLILCLYMLTATGLVYILYRFKIRIA